MPWRREKWGKGPVERGSLARYTNERAEPRAMSRYSLLLGVPAESGTCVQRAVRESPANQLISQAAVGSRFPVQPPLAVASRRRVAFVHVESAGTDNSRLAA